MRRRLVWTVLVTLTIAAPAAQAQERGRTYSHGGLSISSDGEGATLSVRAKEVPRREVFRVLATVFGLEVRPVPGEDQAVSVEFSGWPLEKAIGALLPEGTRFAIRTERERVGHADERLQEKVGPKAESTGRPDKPKEGSEGPAPKGPRKPEPGLSKEPREVVVKGGKPLSKLAPDAPAAKGAKAPRAPLPESAEAVRLDLIMRSSGEIVLKSARAVPGALPDSTLVVGDFVFVVRDAAGAVRRVETQGHPLAQRSYLPSGIHDEKLAKEGRFGVWIPRELLDREGAGLRLQFYDARAMTLPPELDQKSAPGVLEKARPVGEIKAEAVLRALQGGGK